MSPSKFFLQLFDFLLRLPRLLGFFEPTQRLLKGSFQIREHLSLGFKDALCLGDVLQTSRVLLAQLTQLGASQEELRKVSES